jgi:exodeoxyribonuclease V beta subunit
MRDFVVKTAPISGVNLVEASAGTGKTFSVGILVLRCLLEQKLPIGKILMVTFTKAAVAELEERVRKFVRLAYDVAFGNTEFNKDDLIHDLVRASLIKDSENTKKILVRALSHLDELSVMTIHSFCEKNLKEFAFSSGQMFQQEIIADEADLIARFAEEYSQNLLCGEDKHLVVSNSKVSYSDFKDRIKNFLKGEELLALDVIGEDPIAELEDLLKNQLDGLLAYRDDPVDKNGKKFKKAIEKENINLTNTTDLLDFLKPKISNVYVKEIPSPYIEAIHAVLKYETDVPSYIYKKGLHEIAEKVRLHKESRALLSYDDLITKMHDAVNNNAFVTNVSKNYWAVFIDEFQDTDEKQHRIFETIFAENARVLYYIGDPKQSIYSWRSADLDVYDAAKEAVKSDHQFTMTTNFRSEKKYVDAVNALYAKLGNDDFSREKLNYIKVEANNSGDSFNHAQSEGRLNLAIVDKKELHKQVALKIQEVLNSKHYSLQGKKVVASDIGVLVRSGKDGLGVKSFLEEFGIPSILRDGASVFKSDEAMFVLNILRAIDKVNQKNIGVALVGSYFGISSSEWPNRNSEADLIFFKEMQVAFPERGVLSVINQVLNHYRFFEQTNQLGAGDRIQSNVQQLSELLYEQQNKGSEQLADLCQYIEREKKSTFTSDEDDHEKRIESDENAVQISTIHKAKGLQYNIVFALTGFNNEPLRTSTYFSYKDPVTKKKVERFKHNKTSLASLSEDAQKKYDAALIYYKEQSHEENCRMIYVMLTRAVYGSYLFSTEKDETKDKGSFKNAKIAIESLSGQYGICANFEVNSTYPQWEVTIQEESKTIGLRSTKHLQPFAGTYYTQSYSSLSGHAYKPQEKEDYAESELSEYDTYVFDVLPKGAQAGTFMHELFEVADFSDSESWKKAVEKQCKRYGGKYEKEDHKTGLVNLIRNTVESDLGDGLTLNAINNEGKLNEMEFFLTTKDWDVLNNEIVKKDFGERLSLNYDKVPDGFLNGFIDLIFEHNGRYHVLDWKSNHLGNNVANYTADKLDEAMTNSNYHLQYLIYSIALYRYLKQVLGSQFDYDTHMGNVYYLFFRGLRSGQSTGVFTTKIPLEVLQQFD